MVLRRRVHGFRTLGIPSEHRATRNIHVVTPDLNLCMNQFLMSAAFHHHTRVMVVSLYHGAASTCPIINPCT